MEKLKDISNQVGRALYDQFEERIKGDGRLSFCGRFGALNVLHGFLYVVQFLHAGLS
jgi:hypothetical protein